VKGVTPPIPDRKHLNRCPCGRRPYVGMTFDDQYRVACMQMANGCGTTTRYFQEKIAAESAWNKGIYF